MTPFEIETLAEATDRYEARIKRLRRQGSAEALALADKMWACSSAAPCESGACPLCMRTYRLKLLRVSGAALSTKRHFWTFSRIPSIGLAPVGGLRAVSTKKVLAVHRRALRPYLKPDDIAISGVDVSLNVEDGTEPTWMVHGYSVIGTDTRLVLKNAPPTRRHPSIPRPVRRTRGREGGLPEVMSYALKAVFFRRSRYDYIRANGCVTTNTRVLRLSAAHEVELLLFLDRIGIERRVEFVGMRPLAEETDVGPRRPRVRRNE